MKKNNNSGDLGETAIKSSLCEDPREALIEIASGKYDDYFLKLTKIYFSDMYKNNNELKMDGVQIRQKFLENFEFRKTMILFGQKKGLGKDNLQVWNAMTHQINYEGESIDDIKKAYNTNIKEIFFLKKEENKEDTDSQEDPIFSLLSEEDKRKVFLSRKYEGNVKTYTKLFALLKNTDQKEGKDILTYIVDQEVKETISLEEKKELINMLGDKALWEIIHWHQEKNINNHLYERDKKETIKNLILHFVCTDTSNSISPETIKEIIWKQQHRIDNLERKDMKSISEFIIRFLEGIECNTASTDKNIIEAMKESLGFIGRNGYESDFHFKNKNIDFDFFKTLLNKNSNNYFIEIGIDICKEHMEKNKK